MLYCKRCGTLLEDSDLVPLYNNSVPYGDTFVNEGTTYGCPYCRSEDVEEYTENEED